MIAYADYKYSLVADNHDLWA